MVDSSDRLYLKSILQPLRRILKPERKPLIEHRVSYHGVDFFFISLPQQGLKYLQVEIS